MTLINTYLKIFIFLAQVHRPFRGLSSCHIEGSPFYRRNPTTSIKYVSASLNHTNNLQDSIKLCKSMYKNLCRYHIRESMVIYSTRNLFQFLMHEASRSILTPSGQDAW